MQRNESNEPPSLLMFWTAAVRKRCSRMRDHFGSLS